uniref:Uncharacterized protein n=1 Tax=Manihot esculenta TaxID=3983 RepID=A0A2C9W0C6_MANES
MRQHLTNQVVILFKLLKLYLHILVHFVIVSGYCLVNFQYK